MLTRGECKKKLADFEARIKLYHEGKLSCGEAEIQHIESLARAYKVEYAKALQREEPGIGAERHTSYRWWR